jgi:molecular chaperone HscC
MREIEHSRSAANIIGIDLGNTEIVLARFNEAGKPEITNNAEGTPVTPSVIQIDEAGNVIIGLEAKKFLGTATANVFAEFRREMGTEKSWVVGSKIVTPVELSALLLKKVVADYADQFGQPQSIVITWPAYYRNDQREANRIAAARSGLKAVHFISEPAAAALYYSTDIALDGKYLVYDFGGGSLNVTLIEAYGYEITVLHQDAVQQLGEKDFDDALLKVIGVKFRAKTGDKFDAIDCNFGNYALESITESLLTRSSVQIRLLSAKHGPVSIEISRHEFDASISHLIAQAEMACEHVLRCGKEDQAHHVRKSEIKEVFMTGGISRIPAIQASVARLFGKNPKVKNPTLAIAMGAAIYAAFKSSEGTLNTFQARAIAQVDVIDIAPYFYGLIHADWLTGEARNITIIPRGVRIPHARTIKVNADHRGYLPRICLTQSAIEESNADFVTTIWEGELHRFAPYAELDLVFSYDEHGTMCFAVTELATGKCTQVDLRTS